MGDRTEVAAADPGAEEAAAAAERSMPAAAGTAAAAAEHCWGSPERTAGGSCPTGGWGCRRSEGGPGQVAADSLAADSDCRTGRAAAGPRSGSSAGRRWAVGSLADLEAVARIRLAADSRWAGDSRRVEGRSCSPRSEVVRSLADSTRGSLAVEVRSVGRTGLADPARNWRPGVLGSCSWPVVLGCCKADGSLAEEAAVVGSLVGCLCTVEDRALLVALWDVQLEN